MNQKYVIATSTKVSLDGVDVSKIDDALFKRDKAAEKKGADALFDADNKPLPTVVSPERKALQTAVDSKLTANIAKQAMLSDYLKSKFTLTKYDLPHLMKF